MIHTALSNQLPGFEGKFLAATLHDIIQMQCLGMHTRMVRVEGEGLTGRLYFAGGQLVHADVGPLIGEDAFFNILSWPAGAFHIEEGIRATEETIECSWEHLLMDAARRRDEIHPSPLSNTIAQFPPLKPIPMSASPITEAFTDPEVLRAVHYTADATLLESKGEDAEVVQGTFCYVMQLLEHIGTALGADGLKEAQLFGPRSRALCVITEESTAVVIATPKANLNALSKKLS